MSGNFIRGLYKKHVWKHLKKMKAAFVALLNGTYEKYMRSRLKNKDFTILCSNCIGGTIYHRLGLQFLTPTINLYILEPDFIKFVKNPRHYVEQELIFVESKHTFPVGKLDDILIHFNHSKTEEDARRDWNRRKVRINYDNLYIIMYDKAGVTEEEIRQLEQVSCKNKIVLSGNSRQDIPYVKTIKPTRKELGFVYLDKDIFGFRTFEKHFDFVAWLNQ